MISNRTHRLFVAVFALLASAGSAARDISFDPGTAAAPQENAAGRTAEVVLQAMSLAGLRYQYGGSSAATGMDCSALVQHVFREAWKRDLPRTSEEISRAGDQVTARELQPGDLVFFDTQSRPYSHVGIYIGENRFVHSPSAGGTVRLDSMDRDYWKTRYNGARRIADSSQR